MREIAVEGRVRRVETGTYTNKQGQTVPKGTIVLAGEFDKLEIGLGMAPSAEQVAKVERMKAREGTAVRLLVGVTSGDGFMADARFQFLDDLTPSGAKG